MNDKFSRSWFKGADTSSLCRYLCAKLSGLLPMLADENQSYVSLIVDGISGANDFMRVLLHAGLWLLDVERDSAISSGLKAVHSFKLLANEAFKWDLTRWKVQPKFHYFAEVLFALQKERAEDLPSVNPMSCSTQLDEDLVGRVSMASRKVHATTIHLRTLERYLLHVKCNW